MQCLRCQHENRPQAKFCEECGAPLARRCAHCGSELSPTAKFCPECGQPASASTQTRFASPDVYTPKHLAEKILTSKSAVEGERKQVTVLFADLKGSLELLADRDAEEARRLLDPVLEHMMEAVHRYEGTVNQVMGDGIMALFGAPLAHEDHAIRACYAALRMQESVKHYAEGVRRTEGIAIQIRVGLNSGDVVVRSIGSDLRMDYTAVGQTTHVASRLEQMALPGSILLSAETLALAEGYVQVKPLGPMPVKGLHDPLEVYEVTGAGTLRSRMEALAARGLSRFVGRDAEIDALYQALENTRSGRGQVVAVVGEPGVGKSRLFWEFTHSHRTQGCLILESGSVSYGKAMAYLPVIDLLKAYFQIEARDEARRIREKVTGKVFSLDRALEPSLPVHLSLLDVAPDDPQWDRLDPHERRQRTLDGVKRLLLREGQVQPLLMVFEDLHWVDAETQALLDSLVESLPTARLLLLVNYRPEYQHNWGSKSYYRQLRIDPLPAESAEQLLEAALGNDASLLPLKRLLIERTEGNPFFLEESVRTLVETGTLIGTRGAYRLEKAPERLQIPATAQAILAARIDRLPTDEKRLLQAASVIGKEVPSTLLQAIAEQPEEELRRGLAHLQSAEFLYEMRLFPDLVYTFKHALTHDVAYESLLQERRRALHARIVDAIEKLHADRLSEQVDQLAHHALRGELWGKAVTYLRQAGAKAFARSANRQSVNCLDDALAALGHLPETPETRQLAVDIRLALRNALFPIGDFKTGLAHLYEAERLARSLADERRLVLITAYLSEHARLAGHAKDACVFAEEVATLAEKLADLPLRVAGNYYLGTAYFTCGEYRHTGEYFRTILQLLEGDRQHERFGLAGFPAVMARVFWAWSLAQTGEFDHGMVLGQEAIRLAETLEHPYSLAFASRALGQVHAACGEYDEAIRLAERGLEVAREWNLAFVSSVAMDLLGHAYALSGRVTEAVSVLQQALTAIEAMGLVMFRTDMMVHLGEAYLLADRREDASTLANACIALSHEHGHRSGEASALHLIGHIALQDPPQDSGRAAEHLHRALALSAELGMRPLAARCHFELATLQEHTGDSGQARQHLDIASAIQRELGVQFPQTGANAQVTLR